MRIQKICNGINVIAYSSIVEEEETAVSKLGLTVAIGNVINAGLFVLKGTNR